MSDNKLQVQEVKRTLNRIKAKKLHVGISLSTDYRKSRRSPKLQKTEDPEKKNPPQKKEKKRKNTLSRINIRLHLTSTQKFFNQEETSEIFKVLREKQTHKLIL